MEAQESKDIVAEIKRILGKEWVIWLKECSKFGLLSLCMS